MVGRRDALAGIAATVVGGLAGCTSALPGGGGSAKPREPAEPSFDGPSWAQFGGGPARRGRANGGTGPVGGASLTWSMNVGSMSVYGAVVAGNTIFHAEERTVAAYAAADGSQRWKTADWSKANTPTFADGSLYVPNGDSGVAVLDPATGEERWNLGGDGVYASPTVVGGTLYAVRPGRGVVAFDVDAREQTATIETETGHALATDGDRLYLRGQEGLLVVADGAVRSRVELPPAAAGYPVVGDDLAFAASCDDRPTLTAVDPASGRTAWTYETDAGCGLSGVVNPALGDGLLVYAFGDTVAGIDPASGDELWTTTLDSPRGVAVAGEAVYVTEASGGLVSLDASSGEKSWEISVATDDGVGTNQPMVVGDRVYLHDGRTLAAVDAP